MTKEAPRKLAICSHVLNNNSKPLVIKDVSLDERTKHAFALTPNFPRFYAGSPIISNTGYTLGTFCVFDDTPKELEHSKIDGLRMLADQFINVYESTLDTSINFQENTSNSEIALLSFVILDNCITSPIIIFICESSYLLSSS